MERDVVGLSHPTGSGPGADKWTMLVILALERHGTLRFSQVRREVEGVTQKMLTQTLRGLLREWPYDNIEDIQLARAAFDTAAGQPSVSAAP